MNSLVVFEEKQKFKQIWIWLLLALVNGQFVFAIIYQVIYRHAYGNNPMSNTGLIISGIASLIFSSLLFTLRLDTLINNKGISVRFFPFQQKFKTYDWDLISNVHIREYKALSEFGGWGLRLGAYNISGKFGLQLEFKDGSKFLIGTNKAEEIERALALLKK